VETTLSNGWTETPIQYDNVPFDPPPFGWISVNLLSASSYPETLGQSGKDRLHGYVSMRVFVPRNTGTATAFSYADTLGNLFRRKTIDDVTFGSYTARRVESPYDGYICVVVDVYYWLLA